jgi:hypothetical protein
MKKEGGGLAIRTHETWDHLLVLLGKMQTAFQEFRVLLRDEERVLLGMDQQRVTEVTEKKEQALDVMCCYEQQVMTILQELTGVEGKEHLGAWLRKAHEPQAVLVSTIFHDMRDVIDGIGVQGKKNKALIQRMQHVVRNAIDIIYMGLGPGPVYQGSGTLQSPAVPCSVHFHG